MTNLFVTILILEVKKTQVVEFCVGTAFKFKLFIYPSWKLSVCMKGMSQTSDMVPSDYNPMGGRDKVLGL